MTWMPSAWARRKASWESIMEGCEASRFCGILGKVVPIMSCANTSSLRIFLRAIGVGAVAAVALSGCGTTYGPQALRAGASLNDVTASLGAPTARYPRSDGERVEYARGPYGKHTFMLDFDAQGRLVSWEQVLTEPTFDA